MVPNADEMLHELLKDEKYKKEWDENQKFEDDPRITKKDIGVSTAPQSFQYIED